MSPGIACVGGSLGVEVPVKGKQTFLYGVLALVCVAGLVGCKKDDSAAVNTVQELTTQLSEQVAAQNEELSGLAETLRTCREAKADAKDREVVHEPSDSTVEAPSLEGEVSMDSLGAFKDALNETIEQQKAALADLKAKVERCASKLEKIEAGAEGGAAKEGGGKKGAGKKGKKGGGKKGPGKKGKAAQE
jgi:hypothetical protein